MLAASLARPAAVRMYLLMVCCLTWLLTVCPDIAFGLFLFLVRYVPAQTRRSSVRSGEDAVGAFLQTPMRVQNLMSFWPETLYS